MKLATCFLAAIALLLVYFGSSSVSAAPQRFEQSPFSPQRHQQPRFQTLPYYPRGDVQPKFQTLPYYPSKHSGVQLLRARRAVDFTKEIAPKPDGSVDGKIQVSKMLTKNDVTLGAAASASGNTKTGPVSTSLSLGASTKNLGVGISRDHTPGGMTSITKTAQAQLLNTPSNQINANVFKQNNKLPQGLEFQKNGGSLEWLNSGGHSLTVAKESIPGYKDTFVTSGNANIFNNGIHKFDLGASQARTSFADGFKSDTTSGRLSWDHINGHGANLGLSRTSGLGDQFSISSRANLFTSNDGRTRIDAFGGGSKWLNGPLNNRPDFNFGLGASHFFG